MTSPTRFAFDTLARGDVLPTVDLTITHDDVRAYLDAWDVALTPELLTAIDQIRWESRDPAQ